MDGRQVGVFQSIENGSNLGGQTQFCSSFLRIVAVYAGLGETVFLLFKFYFYIMLYVFCLHICMCALCLRRSKEDIAYLGTGVKNGCESACGCQK